MRAPITEQLLQTKITTKRNFGGRLLPTAPFATSLLLFYIEYSKNLQPYQPVVLISKNLDIQRAPNDVSYLKAFFAESVRALVAEHDVAALSAPPEVKSFQTFIFNTNVGVNKAPATLGKRQSIVKLSVNYKPFALSVVAL